MHNIQFIYIVHSRRNLKKSIATDLPIFFQKKMHFFFIKNALVTLNSSHFLPPQSWLHFRSSLHPSKWTIWYVQRNKARSSHVPRNFPEKWAFHPNSFLSRQTDRSAHLVELMGQKYAQLFSTRMFLVLSLHSLFDNELCHVG